MRGAYRRRRRRASRARCRTRGLRFPSAHIPSATVGTVALRVMVVSGVRLYREGLVALLSGCEDIEVIGTAASVDEDLQSLAEHLPDVLLVDSSMIHAFLRHGAELLPNTRVVAFAAFEEQEEILLICAKLGATGFLSHDASLNEMVAAIRCAVDGGIHCSPRIAGLFIRRVAHQALAVSSTRPDAELTGREAQVLDLIASGLSNKEIARRLGIESATVKNHVHNLLEKLHVRRRGQAAALNVGRGVG